MAVDISIVIPVFNEEESLSILFERISALRSVFDRSFEVICVNDGSTDTSAEVLNALQVRHQHVQIIHLKKNCGQTAAIAAGIDHARGEVIVTMDADLQNDPADIPLLVRELEQGYDVVSGWRKDRKDNVLFRLMPSYLANKLISWYTGVWLHDYGCTLKAYRSSVIKNINLYGEMHRFIPALASFSSAARITECVVQHHQRCYGVSKYGLSRTLNVILDLLTVKFWLASERGPMHIFGRMGFWLCAIGGGSALITVAMKLMQGKDITGNPFLYLAVFLGVVGLQFISMGLLGEVNARIYATSQQRKPYIIDTIVE